MGTVGDGGRPQRGDRYVGGAAQRRQVLGEQVGEPGGFDILVECRVRVEVQAQPPVGSRRGGHRQVVDRARGEADDPAADATEVQLRLEGPQVDQRPGDAVAPYVGHTSRASSSPRSRW